MLLDIALAAAEDRPVVVVDDVERGLDPEGARQAWRALAALAAEGRAVIAAATSAEHARGAATAVLTLDAAPT